MKGWLYAALSWLVTLAYLVAMGFSSWVLDGRGMAFPMAAAALTGAYGVLMTLLWS